MLKKSTKTKSVTYLGMTGYGKTMQAAKNDACRRIEAAMDGHYTPHIVRWRGYTGVAWREPVAGVWSYSVVRPDQADGLFAGGSTVLADGSELTCRWAMLRHLADLGWKPEDGKAIPDILEQSPLVDQHAFVNMVRFWLACAHARDVLKLTDNELHRWACEHEGDF